MTKPQINVTPLIDVLLVLLIIFMVVVPLRPSSFSTRVPSEPDSMNVPVRENPKTLIVTVDRDRSVKVNRESPLGEVDELERLISRLETVFADRIANGDVSESIADDPLRPYRDRIERTVFVKAPKDLEYGTVVRVVDAVKTAGGYPISLQIDGLDE